MSKAFTNSRSYNTNYVSMLKVDFYKHTFVDWFELLFGVLIQILGLIVNNFIDYSDHKEYEVHKDNTSMINNSDILDLNMDVNPIAEEPGSAIMWAVSDEQWAVSGDMWAVRRERMLILHTLVSYNRGFLTWSIWTLSVKI